MGGGGLVGIQTYGSKEVRIRKANWKQISFRKRAEPSRGQKKERASWQKGRGGVGLRVTGKQVKRTSQDFGRTIPWVLHQTKVRDGSSTWRKKKPKKAWVDLIRKNNKEIAKSED